MLLHGGDRSCICADISRSCTDADQHNEPNGYDFRDNGSNFHCNNHGICDHPPKPDANHLAHSFCATHLYIHGLANCL